MLLQFDHCRKDPFWICCSKRSYQSTFKKGSLGVVLAARKRRRHVPLSSNDVVVLDGTMSAGVLVDDGKIIHG